MAIILVILLFSVSSFPLNSQCPELVDLFSSRFWTGLSAAKLQDVTKSDNATTDFLISTCEKELLRKRAVEETSIVQRLNQRIEKLREYKFQLSKLTENIIHTEFYSFSSTHFDGLKISLKNLDSEDIEKMEFYKFLKAQIASMR